MSHANIIADELGIRLEQATAAIALFEAGNTIPFVARYRKEATQGLDEEQLRRLSESLERLRKLDERRETILGSIEEQGKLTAELRQEIESARAITQLEDLYAPYKPRRRTRASIARENGLQPLADLILRQERTVVSLDRLAEKNINEKITTIDDAWAGARDIVAETISDHPEIRRMTRERALKRGVLQSEKVENAQDAKGVYNLYYAFEMPVDRLKPHQTLAVNRGEKEKVLRLRLAVQERDWREPIESVLHPDRQSPLREQLMMAINDAAERLLLPAIERDVRRTLTEKAEAHAIAVFAENLRALLSQPPLAGHVTLGIDPGLRTGCKLAVVDRSGKVLETGTIYPHEPQREWKKSLEALAWLVGKFGVTLITIGNGTASRETEQLTAELIKTLPDVRYLIVSEAGASVYSASPLARAELPGLDVSLRGAVSIARRAQDPLAELVKIDPKSIGVGLYQHDVDQKQLAQSLHGVVESVVNKIGVDLNTASPALLGYVAGIGPKLAEKIVAHRSNKGLFQSREALHEVAGLGPKAFQQAAGFLRIMDGANPLDASAIHPESYETAEAVLLRAQLKPGLQPAARKPALAELLMITSPKALAKELGVGEPTLHDIIEQLVRPGRDPRQDLPAPILRSDVLKMEDLAVGTKLKGTVRNVVDFGAFVDIGVKQDGLLHRSQVPPGTLLKVGDVIEVTVLSVEIERGRIGLALFGDKS